MIPLHAEHPVNEYSHGCRTSGRGRANCILDGVQRAIINLHSNVSRQSVLYVSRFPSSQDLGILFNHASLLAVFLVHVPLEAACKLELVQTVTK